MKRVLVTGGAGYVGSTLVPLLLERGYKTRVLDCFMFGRAPLISHAGDLNLEVVKGRIENPDTVRQVMKDVDAVIHLADLANDPACDLNPALSWRVVHEGTKLVAREAKKQGVERFIFASSCSVYGAGSKTRLTEESELNPISLYAKLKLENEKFIRSLEDRNFHTCCLRKGTIFGYSPRLRLDLVINTMTAIAMRSGQISVFGGSQWRPNLHVKDAGHAYIKALEAEPEKIKNKIFNVGSNDQNLQIAEIGQLIKKVIPETRVLTEDTVDKRSYNVCFDKISKELGFKARFTVEDGIKQIKHVFDNNLISNFNDPVYYNVRQLKAIGFLDDA